jgi:uncharacterized protein (TIGR02646 family)
MSKADANIKTEWNSFRQLAAYRDLRGALEAFAGKRNRCYYCSDSLNVDVEHFKPKEEYPKQAFVYTNLLMCCTGCNRLKGTKYPCDAQGHSLIVEPTLDDPWDCLFFVPLTGMLAPRYVPTGTSGHAPSPKGEKTLEILGTILNGYAATEGRRQNWILLVRELANILASNTNLAGHTRLALFGHVDEYGLTEWLFSREGAESSDVLDLRRQYEERWRILRDIPRH